MPADDASPRLPLGGSSRALYQWCLVQVVPDVARMERLNAGVIVLARTAGYLACEVVVDEGLWLTVAPQLAMTQVRAQLHGLAAVASGAAEAGPIAGLAPAQRFHWLTSPSSTVVQPGPVHTGLRAAELGSWEAVTASLAGRLLRRTSPAAD